MCQLAQVLTNMLLCRVHDPSGHELWAACKRALGAGQWQALELALAKYTGMQRAPLSLS